MPRSPASSNRVVRQVMLGHLLFIAGHSLTTGTFFNYFVFQFSPSAFLLAALMIAPETSQSLSVFSRRLVLKFRNRKRIWMTCLIAGRLAALMIPLALLWLTARNQIPTAPLYFILICTIVWYLLQGFAFVNYISWLSDLVPENSWGRLFSRRQMAGLAISFSLPLVIVLLRERALEKLPEAAEQLSYAVIFILGGSLTLASILPMREFQDVEWQRANEPVPHVQLRHIPLTRSFRYLLASRWWLAFFQGLTQAVIFQFAVGELKISLTTYVSLVSLMLLIKFPVTWWAGQFCDRFQEKQILIWSMFILSCAMPFWIWATPQTWGLIIFAYVIWGGFSMLDICGQNLCLKLAPASDNAAHIALYEQVSGFIAGIAGLLGGWCLDQLLGQAPLLMKYGLTPYALLLGISWIGRMTAPLWLLPVKQPQFARDKRFT